MPFQVFTASAGSGKTYSLALEYIKLILHNPKKFRNILAVTFTMKATQEIKDRIILFLWKLATADSDAADMCKQLGEVLNMNEEEVQNKAKECLRLIIHQYSQFHIRTIDSLFTGMLRAVQMELPINQGYRIELNTAKVITDTVALFYQNLAYYPKAKEWLLQAADKRMNMGGSFLLHNELQKMGKDLFSEKWLTYQREIAINTENLHQRIIALYSEWNETKKKSSLLAEKLLHSIKDNGYEDNTISYFLSGLKQITAGKCVINDTSLQILRGEKEFYKSSSIGTERKNELSAFGQNVVAPIGREILPLLENLTAFEIFFRNAFTFGLLTNLNEQLIRYRDSENIFLLSDINAFFREILRDQDIHFIYEKTGSRYENLLLDEFQDTSDFQWHNLLPYIKNSIGEGHKTIIVGDPKQSIYRWRDADASIITEKVFEALNAFKDNDSHKNLTYNYRSAREIIAFNNRFFAYAADAISNHPFIQGSHHIRMAYASVEQQNKRQDSGLVQIEFISEIVSEDENKRQIKEIAIDRAIQIIQHNLHLGYEYRHIMVLAEKNNELQEMAERLRQDKIPFITEVSQKLIDLPQIAAIYAFIRFLLGERDAVLHKQMEIILWSGKKSLQNILTHRKAKHEKLFPHSGVFSQPLAGLYQQVLYIIETYFPLSFPDPAVQYFLQRIMKANAEKELQISDFLQWWEEEKENLILPGSDNENAVTLITVHKAKGLESPIIILPFATTVFGAKNGFWSDKLPEFLQAHFPLFPLTFNRDLIKSKFKEAALEEYRGSAAERLNVVYVAFSRARDKLYILTKAHVPPKTINSTKIVDKDMKLENILFSFTQKHPPHLRDEDRNSCIYGSDMAHHPIDKKEKNNRQLNYFPRLIDSRLPLRHIEEETLFDEIWLTPSFDAKRRGLLVHSIFENADTTDDFYLQLKKMKINGLLSGDEFTSLTKQFKLISEMPEVKDWFSGEYTVWKERDILYESKLWRPDRVLIKDSAAWIIDFKKEKEDESYARQINQYARLLSTLGYRVKGQYIFYTTTLQIHTL